MALRRNRRPGCVPRRAQVRPPQSGGTRRENSKSEIILVPMLCVILVPMLCVGTKIS